MRNRFRWGAAAAGLLLALSACAEDEESGKPSQSDASSDLVLLSKTWKDDLAEFDYAFDPCDDHSSQECDLAVQDIASTANELADHVKYMEYEQVYVDTLAAVEEIRTAAAQYVNSGCKEMELSPLTLRCGTWALTVKDHAVLLHSTMERDERNKLIEKIM
ncbi:hypothetical protein ACWDYJ_35395 [Streptomyces sp. NPDC003042]